MKMKATHKIIPAMAMLLVSAVVLSTASYAWFTMSRTVTATGITLNAIAPTNLLISNAVDGTYLETAAVTETFGTAKLIPASSVDGIKFFAPRALKFANDGAPDATTYFDDVSLIPIVADPITDGYYADFKFWLKTTGEDPVDVTVSQILSAITDNELTTATGISRAARFAILKGNGTALDGAPSNTYGLLTATDDTNPASNVDWFTDVGPADALLSTTGPIVSFDAATNIRTEKLAVDALNLPETMPETYMTLNSDNKLFTVPADGAEGSPFAITIRVWIEGQDAECITSETPADFNIKVGFSDVNYKKGINGTEAD